VSPTGVALVRVPVYSLTINRDTVIWAAPLELFSEIALNVRDASPFTNTFYFGLTNGSLLYLTTKAAFAEGGYEPSVSLFTDQTEADFREGTKMPGTVIDVELDPDDGTVGDYLPSRSWYDPRGQGVKTSTANEATKRDRG